MDFKYPYTDFHELNLDWFLAEFKKLTAEWLQVQHDWEDEQQAFQDLHDYVQDYFANLNLYQEVHDILYSPEMQQTIQLMLTNISASQLPTVVANQIASVVASQLAPVVAAQLPNLLNGMLPSFLPDAVAGEAAAWLADHVDPDTGYVIDDSLTISQAAADAKTTGDRLDIASDALYNFSENQKLIKQYQIEPGGINNSGTEIVGSQYMRTPDYYTTSDNVDLLKVKVNAGVYIAYYDNTQTFINRVAATTATVLDTTATYFRLMFYKDPVIDETTARSWISWIISTKTDERFANIEKQMNGFVTADSIGYTIELDNAVYTVRHIVDNSINLNTIRLYSGAINKGSKTLKMWENSDAEGVIRLVGESDYIGGFHGDEQYQSFKMWIDGVQINTSDEFSRKAFKTFDMYVSSKVYHAGTTTQAFFREKILSFADNKVTISNKWTAVGDQMIQQAPLMLFQCNKYNTDNELVFTDYYVDSDYSIYSTSDASQYPATSNFAKFAKLITGYGDININVEQIDPAYESDYRCVTAAYFLTQQDRLKIYFNTIRETVAGTLLEDGHSLVSRFSFSVK